MFKNFLFRVEIYRSSSSEFFNIQEINSLLDKHYQKKESNGKKIYCVYIYLIWYKRFFIDEV